MKLQKPDATTKACGGCKFEKPLTEFYTSKYSISGYESWCKECKSKYAQARYEKKLQDPLIREDLENKRKIWYKNRDLRYVLLYRARARAKKDNIPFNITLEDVVIPEFCPALNIKLCPNVGGKWGTGESPSLDRTDPSKGYISGNVKVISYKANALKSNLTPSQMLQWAHWIIDTQEK